MLWRPTRASAKGNILGQRESCRAAFLLRRKQEVCRGTDDGLLSCARHAHYYRAHFQYVWSTDGVKRWARCSSFHRSSVKRSESDSFWRWFPDPQLLLCLRPSRRIVAVERI